MMGKTMLDLCVEAGMDALAFDKQHPSLHNSGTGYEDVCIFANMGCPGAKSNNMFKLRCVDAKKYDFVEMCSCTCNYKNKVGEYLK